MPARSKSKSRKPTKKITAVGLAGAFLSALGAALAATDVLSWQVVLGAVVTAALATAAGYFKAS